MAQAGSDQRIPKWILIIEDDKSLGRLLQDLLTFSGYRVSHVESAADAEIMLNEVSPDLIILDLMLPDTHGLLLCAKLWERLAVPIIVCSATGRKDDAVLAFKLGAVDFLSKPFVAAELEARINVALLNAPSAPGRSTSNRRPMIVGPLIIDVARRRVILAGQEICVTPTEYRLLYVLVAQVNQVVSRRELSEAVWDHHDVSVERSLEVHLRRLRAKLRTGQTHAPALSVVRGFGYQLVWEPTQDLARSA